MNTTDITQHKDVICFASCKFLNSHRMENV